MERFVEAARQRFEEWEGSSPSRSRIGNYEMYDEKIGRRNSLAANTQSSGESVFIWTR
jgi:hypothetical protein